LFAAAHGQWNFTTFDGAFLYGRVADFADCQGLNLPAYERPLCPAEPPAQRIADFYTWNPESPQWTFTPPAGRSRDAVVRDFSLRILRHQPGAYAEAVVQDFGYGFSPVRGAGPERYSPAYLQFQTKVRPDRQAYASIGKLGYPPRQIRAGPAAFLQLKLGVPDVLAQPAREALAVLVDDVVRESADGAVHAGPLAHRASVVFRVPAVNQPDDQ